MKKRFLSFLLLASPSFASAPILEHDPELDTNTQRPPLVLAQGEQRLLKIPGLRRYSLGSDAVRVHRLTQEASSDQLLIKGIHPGSGDLWVWKADGSTESRSIQIVKLPAEEVRPPLLKALGRLQEVEVLFAGSGVLLRGKVQKLSEATQIAALERAFPKELIDETELSSSLMSLGRKKLENWLQSSPFSSRLRIEEQGNTLWLRGSVSKPSELAWVERQARTLFPAIHTEIESLPDASPTVHFRVFLLELRKNRFSSLGLGWPPTKEGAFRVTTSRIEDLLQLDLALQALEGDGSAKVLSSPELVVRAPGEAELFAGGELPIEVQKKFFADVTWKPFGLILKLKVTHTAGDRVRLDIFTEVSHLDPTIATDKIPGIQASRMKTQVDAQYGTPLLLSGLLQQGTREQARGLPLFRSIPVLGTLFGSSDYLNERSELVAILLPSATPPSAPMSRVRRLFPKGPLPPPRDWISPSEERALKQSPAYPWNALQ